MKELTEYELESIKAVSKELTEKLLDLGLYPVRPLILAIDRTFSLFFRIT